MPPKSSTVCKFFNKGECKYSAADCKDLHPGTTCKYWQTGNCTKGGACTFKHPTVLCNSIKKGLDCPFADTVCQFSHRKLSKTPDRSSAKPPAKTASAIILAPSSTSTRADRRPLGHWQLGAETIVTSASIEFGDSKALTSWMSKSPTGTATYELERVTEVKRVIVGNASGLSTGKSSAPEVKRPVQVGISFDTTGSMSKYKEIVERNIGRLSIELLDQIKNVEISMLAHGDYCDKGERYVDKFIQFTKDPARLEGFLKSAGETGGGDGDECYALVLSHRQLWLRHGTA
eukprot:Colp12_sorted_trinity150504_noHs@22394